MKLTFTQSNILAALQRIGHVAGKHATLPILQNILIRATETVVTFIATNLEVGVATTVRAHVDEPGSITLPAKLTTEFIGLLPDEQVDIITEEHKAKIVCKNAKTTILGAEASDFPLLPERSGGEQILVDAAAFREGVHAVLHAAAPDETRPELNGIFLSTAGAKMTLVATDSYRLAEKTITLEVAPKTALSVILPARAVHELARVIHDVKGKISLYHDGNQVFLEADDVVFTSRIVSGQYPDYAQIIPKEHTTRAVVSTHDLKKAVKGASLFAPAGVNDIHLHFRASERALTISASSGQVGEHTMTVEGEVSGEENNIVFNWRYLIDGLDHTNTEKVTLDVVNATSPGVMRPKDANDYTYLIMPIKQ